MPDQMDRVQELTDLHLDNALHHHASRPRQAGHAVCTNVDCGEPISDQRQALGAQLCIDCQRADEAQAAHFRKWGVR